MNRSDYEYDFSINSCPKIVFVTRRMKQFVAELIIFKYKPKVANIMTNLKICLGLKSKLKKKDQVRIQQDFGAHCACGLRSECGRPFNKCTCANLELCLFIEMICNDR